MKSIFKYTIATAAFATFAAHAQAQTSGTYFSVSGGLTNLQSSANSGELTSAFTTGAGTTIPAGTVLASGTSLSWATQFKNGYNFGGAIGYRYGNGLRGEVEIRYLRNSVTSHTDMSVGGGSIGTEDAGVLITGSGNLGASVSTIVGAGTGNNSTLAVMVNGYYDLFPNEAFTPYIGVGAGYADTKTLFAPSDVAVANASNGGFAYQGIVGALYNVSEAVGVFAEYRYFARDKVRVRLSLLPGYLDTEYKTHMFNAGLRFSF